MSNKLQLYFTQFKIVKNETNVDFNGVSWQSYLKYYIAALYTGICVGESLQDCVVQHVVYGDR